MIRPLSISRALRLALPLGVLWAGAVLAQPALFAPSPGAELSAGPSRFLGALRATRGVDTAVVGRARPELLLAASDVTVALPGGGAAVLRVGRVERRAAGDASWFGTGDEATTSGVFVVRDGGVTGTVRTPDGLFALRPLTGGLHALARLDERAFVDHEASYASFEAAEFARTARDAAQDDAAAALINDPIVTVLVPYTAAALAAHADIAAFVQLAVDETNQSFANSGVTARLALAYAYQTSAAEGASLDVDLPALRDAGDGRFDEVHALRDAFEADVVSMIGEYGTACGLAYLKSTRDYAFSIVSHACATGYYSFGHEIGHNFGAHHDPANGTNTAYAFGHGYVNASAGWRTLMAYNTASCPGGLCARVPYWSSPDVLYGGAPTGDPSVRHNARVINLRAAVMAGFNRSQLLVAGGAGWRMMASPIPAMTVDDLAAQNLVQGVAGYYPEANTTLFTGLDGAGWVPSSGTGEGLASGRGFLWYFFNELILPGGPSASFALPMTLNASYVQASPSTDVAVPLHADGQGWNLVGNPFASSLDVSSLPSWATAGALGSAVGQVWDPAGASYLLTSAMGGTVAAWQGFLIENATATGLTIPASARGAGGVFHLTDETRMVAFEVEGADAATGTPVYDRAAVLYFHPDATDGWDLWDAAKLTPLANAYAALAFTGDRAGAPAAKAQESRPLDPPAAFDVPLTFEAVGTAAAFTLRWPQLANVPASWALELEDLRTGARVDLRAADRYAFTAEAVPARRTVGPPAVASAMAAEERFILHVVPGVVTAEAPAPPAAAFTLAAPAPNPTSGSATVRFEVPQAAEVVVEVLDLLGREVAVLVDGRVEAGRHAIAFDASALPAGVYVVRMRAGGHVRAQRLTVAR